MLNYSAKLVLATSAMTPPLLILAFNLLVREAALAMWLTFLCVALLLLLGSLAILRRVQSQAEKHEVHIHELEPRNYEAITFLLAYIFPFIRQDFSGTVGNLATTATIIALLIVVLVHSEAFHFNPLLRLCGYRFYSIKTRSGVFSLIIMRQPLLNCPTTVNAVTVAPGVYMQKGHLNA